MWLTIPLFLLFAFGSGAALADPFATEWAKTLKSEARLVAGDQNATGVQIHLAPNAITYWRDPGDAGAPPVFDFSASTNLRSAEVVYPAPRRIVESDGSAAYGYNADVLFPIRIVPLDPKKPTALRLKMSYAVCETICLPARADFSLALAPGVSSPYTADIAAAAALAPKPIDAAQVTTAPAEGAEPRQICLMKALGAGPTLFLEGPEGWRASAKPTASANGQSCFLVKVMEEPATKPGSTRVKLTFVGDAGAFETTSDF